MGPRSAIVAGLFVGVTAAVALMVAVLTYAPEPTEPAMTAPATPIRSAPAPSMTVSPTSASTPAPTASADSPDPSGTPSASGGSAFHISEPAPPLVVPQVGGGTIDLAALRGSPVWVNFMATWCPPCQDEFPLMNGFFARYGDTGLVVVAIDVREEEGLVSSFAASLGATFPLGLDLDGRASATWGALALPVHFWIDADGIVRDGALGGIGADVMAEGLRKILPGVDVTP